MFRMFRLPSRVYGGARYRAGLFMWVSEDSFRGFHGDMEVKLGENHGLPSLCGAEVFLFGRRCGDGNDFAFGAS